MVDATQGVEAQTLANVYMAMEHDLEIIPVINKIDLPSAQPEAVRKEIEEVIGLDASIAVTLAAHQAIGLKVSVWVSGARGGTGQLAPLVSFGETASSPSLSLQAPVRVRASLEPACA